MVSPCQSRRQATRVSVRRFKAKCRIWNAVLCIVFDGSPSIPEARCRSIAERKWNMKSSAIGAELFL